jgi:hypothetical protein
MNERKGAKFLGIVFACLFCGIAGAFVGFRTTFAGWPEGNAINEPIRVGSTVGVIGAVITGLLILAAAREKIWLVAIACFVITFSCSWAYQVWEINSLREEMIQFERARTRRK